MASLKDTRDRISSVKNIHKITRAMEMVAAARLRRAEQRIEELRPYAEAIRKMTRRASEAAESLPKLPILEERENVQRVGLLLVTGDRGLAGPFNSQIIRAGNRRHGELSRQGTGVAWYASGKRGSSSLRFRNYRHETLLPLQQADILGEDEDEEEGEEETIEDSEGRDQSRSLWIYEPDPEEILARLVPDYVEISIYRALLESTASEHGARMTAMRNASDNANELIDDLTLEANRQRQAEITQEIMEVVAGAEGLR